jgi:hypothetical protein
MKVTRANLLVNRMLNCGAEGVFEAEGCGEEPEIPEELYPKERIYHVLDYNSALTANYFIHRSLKRSSGAPLIARRNGKTKTWKRQPGKFMIPVKYGLYDCFYITDKDADDWWVVFPESAIHEF